ncbi:hypothetical protein [Streptomyces sp. NPDC059063]|uniref:hypothetical protein n=1 Tax=unclassified Streptomyces TaxID=2593676 RepID=UPI0036A22D94
MLRNTIKRALATTATAVTLAGGLGLATAGTASADDPGCYSSGGKTACIGESGGYTVASAYTDFASNACTVDVVLWNERTGENWHQWSRCGSGHTYYAGPSVPRDGGVYRPELRVYWDGGSGYESQTGPATAG